MTSTVIIQGIEGLRAIEETKKMCFGCAEDECRYGPCRLRKDEEEYEEERACRDIRQLNGDRQLSY